MKHPQLFGLLFHPKFFVTAVFFSEIPYNWKMFLFKVIFSDKVSVHTNELEADIGMPLAGVMHRLSFAQQSSRYQVPWPPVQQRTATAGGKTASPLWEARVCLETGFRLGQFLEILGLEKQKKTFLPMNHSLIHFWSCFAYWRVSRKI